MRGAGGTRVPFAAKGGSEHDLRVRRLAEGVDVAAGRERSSGGVSRWRSGPGGRRAVRRGLRELPDNRRLAILAEAARTSEAQLGDEAAAVREALRAFAELGTALIGARETGEALDAVIANRPGWEGLGDLVSRAAALANTAASDPLDHVLGGYSRFRRYTPRMLRRLDIEASPVAQPLLEAVDVLRSDGTADRLRRGPHNRLGFAYQVAFVRVLGRFPQQAPLEIDGEILRFAALQLGADAETIHAYERRQQTVSEHQSSASVSTCVCARSTPPLANGWRGSSKTKRCGSTARLRAAAVRLPLTRAVCWPRASFVPPGGRGLHRPPAPPGRGGARRLRGAGRDPARASGGAAPPVRIPVLLGRRGA